MTKINLNPCRLLYVAQHCSTEETRYYLNGVHVEPHPEKGIVMVATDGHTLAVAHDPDGSCDRPAIIDTKSGGAIFKAPAKYRDSSRVELTQQPDVGPHAFLARRFVEHPDKGVQDETYGVCREVDGTFPDWRRVVPWDAFDEDEAKWHGAYNPTLIAKFCKPFMNPTGIEFRQRSEHEPTVVAIPGLSWFVGVIMPMRVGSWSANAIRACRPDNKPRRNK